MRSVAVGALVGEILGLGGLRIQALLRRLSSIGAVPVKAGPAHAENWEAHDCHARWRKTC